MWWIEIIKEKHGVTRLFVLYRLWNMQYMLNIIIFTHFSCNCFMFGLYLKNVCEAFVKGRLILSNWHKFVALKRIGYCNKKFTRSELNDWHLWERNEKVEREDSHFKCERVGNKVWLKCIFCWPLLHPCAQYVGKSITSSHVLKQSIHSWIKWASSHGSNIQWVNTGFLLHYKFIHWISVFFLL